MIYRQVKRPKKVAPAEDEKPKTKTKKAKKEKKADNE